MEERDPRVKRFRLYLWYSFLCWNFGQQPARKMCAAIIPWNTGDIVVTAETEGKFVKTIYSRVSTKTTGQFPVPKNTC